MQALNLLGLGVFLWVVIFAARPGALDFIEKPFNDGLFLECIQRGLQANARQRRQDAQRRTVADVDGARV